MKRTVALALLGILLLPASSGAGDSSRPPPARLIADDRGQRGRLWSYCWATSGGGSCADGLPSYGHRLRVPAGERGQIRLLEPSILERASLHGHREIRDADGYEETVGPADRLRTRIRRVLRGGERIGWRVLFRLPDEGGHLYLDLFTRWERGSASYTFHLKLV